ncbi:MAG: class II aldolase/adducin family protein [Candidatus Thorarchaeota archaeon]|jgi:L-ribulose-5-phosphate 4-epimerase
MQDPRKDVLDALALMGRSVNITQDTHGNVSCRDDVGNIYIKPSGVPYDKITDKRDVAVVDVEDKQVDGRLKPSVDTIHHAAIYGRWHNIKAICHTHSPYATAYAYNSKIIRCIGTEQADFFGDDIYVMGYSDLTCWGEETAKYLHYGVKATLLSRHGVLTFGETAVEAVKLAICLENVARKNFLAEQLFDIDSRRELKSLHSIEVKKWFTRYNNSYGQK